VHASLRSKLGEDAPLLASWKLEPGWLELVSGEPLARKSPLAEVRAAGLRFDVEPELGARGLLVCGTPSACDEVATVLRDFSRDLGPILEEELGDNPLEGALIERVETAVQIRVTLTHARATAIIRRLALRLFTGPSEPPPPPPPASGAPRFEPDEVLRP
jgi:hypothetical protein